LMWELEKSSSTLMGRKRDSPLDRRSNNAHRSEHSTGRRNPRKNWRSHQPHPSKPSSNSWKVFGYERRSRCITSGMRSEESSVRNFRSSRRKRSKQASPQKKVRQQKVSSPTITPSGDDNQTQGMESPALDSKPELSP
jgi:hypothetical protein